MQPTPGEDFSATIAAWYEGKRSVAIWTSGHFPICITLLERYRDIAARVLEIGSFEGRSALFFLNFFPRAHLTCIDMFDMESDAELRKPLLLTPNNGIDFAINLTPMSKAALTPTSLSLVINSEFCAPSTWRLPNLASTTGNSMSPISMVVIDQPTSIAMRSWRGRC